MLRVGRFLVDNERLLVVAASTMIMSLSHTALRPVLPVFAKVRLLCLPPSLSHLLLSCAAGVCLPSMLTRTAQQAAVLYQ